MSAHGGNDNCRSANVCNASFSSFPKVGKFAMFNFRDFEVLLVLELMCS